MSLHTPAPTGNVPPGPSSNLPPPNNLNGSPLPWEGTVRCDIPAFHGDPWRAVSGKTIEHDQNQCEAWKDEIDKLLIFASLFSAIAAGFALDSSKQLEVDYQRSTVTILFEMHQQMNSIAQQNASASPTPLLSNPLSTFQVPSHAVHVSACWYLSLILSLATVAVGILCLQWLREHKKNPNASTERVFAFRCVRMRALERWQVPRIIGSLPILLLSSLLLFLAGLAIYLWNLNRTVAITSSGAIGAVAFVILATSVLPVVFPQCPFRSPQAWSFHYIGKVVRSIVLWTFIIVGAVLLLFLVGCVLAFDKVCSALGCEAWNHFAARSAQRMVEWAPRGLKNKERVVSLQSDWVVFDDATAERDARKGVVRSFHWGWFTGTFSHDQEAIVAFIWCLVRKVSSSPGSADPFLVPQMVFVLCNSHPEWKQRRGTLQARDWGRDTTLAAQREFDLGFTLGVRHAVNVHPSLLPHFFFYLLNCHIKLMSSLHTLDDIGVALVDNFIADLFDPEAYIVQTQRLRNNDVHRLIMSLPQPYRQQNCRALFQCLTLRATPTDHIRRHISTLVILDAHFNLYDRWGTSQALDSLNHELRKVISSSNSGDLTFVLDNLTMYLYTWHRRLDSMFRNWTIENGRGPVSWPPESSFSSLALVVNIEMYKPQYRDIRERQRHDMIGGTEITWNWAILAMQAFNVSPPPEGTQVFPNTIQDVPAPPQIAATIPEPTHYGDDGSEIALARVATPAPPQH